MKLPRDQDGLELVKMLKVFGYVMVRQEGSHIRLMTTANGKHHLSVVTGTLKVGTLDQIIGLVAEHFDLSKQDVWDRLNG